MLAETGDRSVRGWAEALLSMIPPQRRVLARLGDRLRAPARAAPSWHPRCAVPGSVPEPRGGPGAASPS